MEPTNDWDIEKRVHAHLKTKYAHLSEEDRYFYHSDLMAECDEALADGIITQAEYDLIKVKSGERWRWAKNN